MNRFDKRLKGTVIIAMLVVAVAAMVFAGCFSLGADEDENLENLGEGIPAASSRIDSKGWEKASDARNTPVVRAARAVGPAVVGITNKAVARDWFNNQFEIEQGVGSGVIFRADGYIVTNNHVIAGAKEIIVSLADGRSVSGELIGTDEITDLAVVKIDADNLTAAEFGDSDDIMVGEPAIAIGNPLGLEFQGSVTAGVISALNRTLNLNDRQFKLIQTDAAINPGNSGGALVNADGLVIGINSAKLAANGVEGMGFAIPINTVRDIVAELMEKGRVIRPWLGVGVFDKETAARQGYRLNADAGVYVEHVDKDGSAGAAGIRRGDIILEIAGKPVNTVGELRSAVAEQKVGTVIQVKLQRDGDIITVDVTLQAMD
ncbi:MAG: trypsin-like peptidase domain-containing protein [Selenomonadaceae bacterium]|nr:trypsin-like peptidase domain-containing protein [Selenomonadaceae bacterium]